MTPPAASEPALVVRGLTKTFGATRALSGAGLEVRAGAVHALLGGNGSGKSTAIKVLAGVHRADAGTLVLHGVEHDLTGFGPGEARAAGLRFVHQDLGLFDGLSVAENFALDAGYPTGGGRIRWRRLHQRVRQVLADYELDVDPGAPVNSLRPADRAMIAIARALQDQEDGEQVLLLDEPTATLAQHESELLLQRVRRRAELGQTVVLVSHRLGEVLSVAHDFTVFRDGEVAGTLVDARPSEDELISLMAGRHVGSLRGTVGPAGAVDAVAAAADEQGDGSLLRVRGLRSGPLRGVDLDVAAGEIVGVAGLVGSGRSTLLRTLFGVHHPDAGSVTLDGEPHAPAHVTAAMRGGVRPGAGGPRAGGGVPRPLPRREPLGDRAARPLGPARDVALLGAGHRHPAARRPRRPGCRSRRGARPRSRAATSRRSSSRAGSSASRGCCCSMSPPRAWT